MSNKMHSFRCSGDGGQRQQPINCGKPMQKVLNFGGLRNTMTKPPICIENMPTRVRNVKCVPPAPPQCMPFPPCGMPPPYGCMPPMSHCMPPPQCYNPCNPCYYPPPCPQPPCYYPPCPQPPQCIPTPMPCPPCPPCLPCMPPQCPPAKPGCCGAGSTLMCVPRGCPPMCRPCPPRCGGGGCGGENQKAPEKPASYNNCNFYVTESRKDEYLPKLADCKSIKVIDPNSCGGGGAPALGGADDEDLDITVNIDDGGQVQTQRNGRGLGQDDQIVPPPMGYPGSNRDREWGDMPVPGRGRDAYGDPNTTPVRYRGSDGPAGRNVNVEVNDGRKPWKPWPKGDMGRERQEAADEFRVIRPANTQKSTSRLNLSDRKTRNSSKVNSTACATVGRDSTPSGHHCVSRPAVGTNNIKTRAPSKLNLSIQMKSKEGASSNPTRKDCRAAGKDPTPSGAHCIDPTRASRSNRPSPSQIQSRRQDCRVAGKDSTPSGAHCVDRARASMSKRPSRSQIQSQHGRAPSVTSWHKGCAMVGLENTPSGHHCVSRTEARRGSVRPSQSRVRDCRAVGQDPTPSGQHCVDRARASVDPSRGPSVRASVDPSRGQSVRASVDPSRGPSVRASVDPSRRQSARASREPSRGQSARASREPSRGQSNVNVSVQMRNKDGQMEEVKSMGRTGVSVEPSRGQSKVNLTFRLKSNAGKMEEMGPGQVSSTRVAGVAGKRSRSRITINIRSRSKTNQEAEPRVQAPFPEPVCGDECAPAPPVRPSCPEAQCEDTGRSPSPAPRSAYGRSRRRARNASCAPRHDYCIPQDGAYVKPKVRKWKRRNKCCIPSKGRKLKTLCEACHERYEANNGHAGLPMPEARLGRRPNPVPEVRMERRPNPAPQPPQPRVTVNVNKNGERVQVSSTGRREAYDSSVSPSGHVRVRVKSQTRTSAAGGGGRTHGDYEPESDGGRPVSALRRAPSGQQSVEQIYKNPKQPHSSQMLNIGIASKGSRKNLPSATVSAPQVSRQSVHVNVRKEGRAPEYEPPRRARSLSQTCGKPKKKPKKQCEPQKPFFSLMDPLCPARETKASILRKKIFCKPLKEPKFRNPYEDVCLMPLFVNGVNVPMTLLQGGGTGPGRNPPNTVQYSTPSCAPQSTCQYTTPACAPQSRIVEASRTEISRIVIRKEAGETQRKITVYKKHYPHREICSPPPPCPMPQAFIIPDFGSAQAQCATSCEPQAVQCSQAQTSCPEVERTVIQSYNPCNPCSPPTTSVITRTKPCPPPCPPPAPPEPERVKSKIKIRINTVDTGTSYADLSMRANATVQGGRDQDSVSRRSADGQYGRVRLNSFEQETSTTGLNVRAETRVNLQQLPSTAEQEAIEESYRRDSFQGSDQHDSYRGTNSRQGSYRDPDLPPYVHKTAKEPVELFRASAATSIPFGTNSQVDLDVEVVHHRKRSPEPPKSKGQDPSFPPCPPDPCFPPCPEPCYDPCYKPLPPCPPPWDFCYPPPPPPPREVCYYAPPPPCPKPCRKPKKHHCKKKCHKHRNPCQEDYYACPVVPTWEADPPHPPRPPPVRKSTNIEVDLDYQYPGPSQQQRYGSDSRQYSQQPYEYSRERGQSGANAYVDGNRLSFDQNRHASFQYPDGNWMSVNYDTDVIPPPAEYSDQSERTKTAKRKYYERNG